MADHAISRSAAVQSQLDRLKRMSPGGDRPGLERISELMARLGNPQHALPPVFHVAGTNGKGSTCAFLRAALESDGRRVHVFTSPHLVRLNERIRLSGGLITDAELAIYLSRVLDVAGGIVPSFFEATTAAALLAFAEQPADACIVEVGLGGRLDATNVIPKPAVCGIAQLGLDHESFLGNTIDQIAGEKAGIAKPRVPLVTLDYAPSVSGVIAGCAAAAGAPLHALGTGWEAEQTSSGIVYRDAIGALEVTAPALAGRHQLNNLALAIAMLRHQRQVPVFQHALLAAPLKAQWPARLSPLTDGPLLRLLPPGSRIWLDGGHNAAAGKALAEHFRGILKPGEQLQLIIGMLADKDVAGFLDPFAGLVAHIRTVPVPNRDYHGVERFMDVAARWDIPCSAYDAPAAALAALGKEGGRPKVLITGSLYLAGEVLEANGQLPH